MMSKATFVGFRRGDRPPPWLQPKSS